MRSKRYSVRSPPDRVRSRFRRAGGKALLRPLVLLLVVLSAYAVVVHESGSVSLAQQLGLPDLAGPQLPANDLESMLALTGAQRADETPPRNVPGPALQPVPRARCDERSRPLDGIQGRVPSEAIDSPAAAQGWTCNVTEVARHETPGGFRVWRYEDRQDNTCAYYDTSLSSPANVASLAGGPSPGVVVLDMSDPSRPEQTALLTTPGMLAPHESLNLNRRRGLLAAEVGNGLTLPGSVDIYDISQDCRYPQLLSTMPNQTGHESGFTKDGNTLYVAGGAGYITAIDVSDPSRPRELWRGAYYSHGLNLSDDGRTLYQTDPINGNLGILDVSEIQARKPDPQVRETTRISWDSVSIPQNTVPLTIDGRPHLLEFDEFAFRFNPPTVAHEVGAARLIDIGDPRRARVVSNLRLEVNMRDTHRAVSGDPTPLSPGKAFGYTGHYCAVPRTVDPEIVACSFTNSGLRVFDISEPRRPREVAYFVAPPKSGTAAGFQPGNLALSQPAFDRERRQVWYSDATAGFYVLQLSRSAWPQSRPNAPADDRAGDGRGGDRGRDEARSRDGEAHDRGETHRVSTADPAEADSNSGTAVAGLNDREELPFTGLTLALVGLAGVGLVGGGFAVRVLAARDRPSQAARRPQR